MNSKNRWASAVIIFGALLFGALIYNALYKQAPVKVDSGSRDVMGTFASIVAVAADTDTADKSIEAAFSQLRQVDNLMSDYKPDSQLSCVNRLAHNQPTEVNQPLFEVLQKAVEYSRKTGGAFDITVGTLVDLYRSAEENQTTPTKEQLAFAKSKTGFQKLELDENNRTVKFAAEGMRLDLGGIAKGYAIDKAVEAMQNEGALGGMVDVGGDIRCFGSPPADRKKWLIGLQEPTQTNKLINQSPFKLLLEVSDLAVATSGDYQRFVLIEGKKYSHIIDIKQTDSGSELTSVTIIATKAIDADALATAVSVMGTEKGLALIETIPNTEAILISSQEKDKLVKTTGAKKYIKR